MFENLFGKKNAEKNTPASSSLKNKGVALGMAAGVLAGGNVDTATAQEVLQQDTVNTSPPKEFGIVDSQENAKKYAKKHSLSYTVETPDGQTTTVPVDDSNVPIWSHQDEEGVTDSSKLNSKPWVNPYTGKVYKNSDYPTYDKDTRPTLAYRAKEKGVKIDPTTIPEDGYNAADHIITQDGKIRSIRPEQQENNSSPTVDQNVIDATMEELGEKGLGPDYTKPESVAPTGPTADNPPSEEELPIPENTTLKYNPPRPKSTEQSNVLNSTGDIKITPEDLPTSPEEIVQQAIQTLANLLEKAPGILKGRNLVTLLTLATSALAHNTNANAQSYQDLSKEIVPNKNHSQGTTFEDTHNSAVREAWLDYVNYPEKHHFKKITPEEFLEQYSEKYSSVSVGDLKNFIKKMDVLNNSGGKTKISTSNMKPRDNFLNSLKTVEARPLGRIHLNRPSSLKNQSLSQNYPINSSKQNKWDSRYQGNSQLYGSNINPVTDQNNITPGFSRKSNFSGSNVQGDINAGGISIEN